MVCKIDEMQNRQVVCVETGTVLGFVSDVEFDTETGTVTSVVIYGKPRLMGLFGREDDIVIPWSNIEVIGEETVLVKNACFEMMKK